MSVTALDRTLLYAGDDVLINAQVTSGIGGADIRALDDVITTAVVDVMGDVAVVAGGDFTVGDDAADTFTSSAGSIEATAVGPVVINAAFTADQTMFIEGSTITINDASTAGTDMTLVSTVGSIINDTTAPILAGGNIDITSAANLTLNDTLTSTDGSIEGT
ncbi:hypothetical protein HY772_04885, partial [Candidatus Woesearchaeota archaeon]|nr:hypothetical protein [Candidatus Woesearchaeota archaeon]